MSVSVEQIREKARDIVARINIDSDFKAQVEHDPEGTLVLAGLPVEAVPDFLSKTPLPSFNEVCQVSCFYSCLYSNGTATIL